LVASPHMLAGSLIAVLVKKIFIGRKWMNKKLLMVFVVCSVSFFCHFLLDAIPHKDYAIKSEFLFLSSVYLLIDMMIGSCIILFVFREPLMHFLRVVVSVNVSKIEVADNLKLASPFFLASLGVFFNILPDVFMVLKRILGMDFYILSQLEIFHNAMHSNIFPDLFWGWASQISFSFMVVVLLVRLVFKVENKIYSWLAVEEAERILSEVSQDREIEK